MSYPFSRPVVVFFSLSHLAALGGVVLSRRFFFDTDGQKWWYSGGSQLFGHLLLTTSPAAVGGEKRKRKCCCIRIRAASFANGSAAPTVSGSSNSGYRIRLVHPWATYFLVFALAARLVRRFLPNSIKVERGGMNQPLIKGRFFFPPRRLSVLLLKRNDSLFCRQFRFICIMGYFHPNYRIAACFCGRNMLPCTWFDLRVFPTVSFFN